MRIAVLGTGALGCLWAAHLAAHAEVWMLGTWAEGIAAIRQHGVTVCTAEGCWQARVSVAATPDDAPPAEVVLTLVKSYQTARAARWAAQIAAPDGLVVTLQNGLDNLPRLAAAVGPARAVAGATAEGATLLAPGRVRHAGRGPTWLGARAENAVAVEALASLFLRAGFDARVTDDIEGLLWRKAILNAAINPLSALWRVPNGELLATDGRRRLLAQLAQEAADVARARGVRALPEDPFAAVSAVCRATAANRSSMLQDVERGRPTEIDSINGVIVQIGRQLGVATPLNEAVWQLVRALS